MGYKILYETSFFRYNNVNYRELTMIDHYQTLGISYQASFTEIKQAYRKYAHKYHPDTHNGDEVKFKKINEAYQTLKDPVKRRYHDMDLKEFYGYHFFYSSSRQESQSKSSQNTNNQKQNFNKSYTSDGKSYSKHYSDTNYNYENEDTENTSQAQANEPFNDEFEDYSLVDFFLDNIVFFTSLGILLYVFGSILAM